MHACVRDCDRVRHALYMHACGFVWVCVGSVLTCVCVSCSALRACRQVRVDMPTNSTESELRFATLWMGRWLPGEAFVPPFMTYDNHKRPQVCARVCVCVCARARVVLVCAYARVTVRAHVPVHPLCPGLFFLAHAVVVPGNYHRKMVRLSFI